MQRISSQKLKYEHLKNIQHFIFDCDGVLWNGNKLIDGAAALLNKLHFLEKKFILLTNNSTKSKEQYLLKCQQLALPVSADNIVCTASLAASYLKKIDFQGKLYMLGSKGLSAELQSHNIDHTPPGKEANEADELEDFHQVKLEAGITGVLVGFDPCFSYVKLLRAVSHIRATGVYIATNEDASFPTNGSDIIIPGTGSIVSAVTKAAGVEPVVVGKPNTSCLEAIQIAHPWLDPTQCVMVGDRLDTDIVFGNRCAMRTLLVMTGVTKPADIENVSHEDLRPHFWAPSVKELFELLC